MGPLSLELSSGLPTHRASIPLCCRPPHCDQENIQASVVVELKARRSRAHDFRRIHFRLDAANFVKKVVASPITINFLRHTAEAL
jgi:hypothetical protein